MFQHGYHWLPSVWVESDIAGEQVLLLKLFPLLTLRRIFACEIEQKRNLNGLNTDIKRVPGTVEEDVLTQCLRRREPRFRTQPRT